MQANAVRWVPGRHLGLRGALLVGVLGYAALFAWAIVRVSYDIAGALVVGPILLAVWMPIAVHLTRDEYDLRVRSLIVAAPFVKLGGAVVRFLAERDLYGLSDAALYHDHGARIAESLRSGTVEFGTGTSLVGTEFIKVVTGVLYAATGPTILGGFLLFASIGLAGQFLFYRGFRIAVPDGSALRYAVLVLLLPSLLFWPAAIGKDAWMVFGLGLAAYGAARMLSKRAGGPPLVALGLVAAGIVRPHVALIAAAALAGAYVVRLGTRTTDATARPFGTAFALVTIGLAGVIAASQVEAMFGLETLDPAGIEQVLGETARQTGIGGSVFDVEPGFRPWLFPLAAVTVLFRPFPFEAHNIQTLVQSLEGVLLLVLIVIWRHELRRLWRRARTNPYLAFVALFAILFVLAFANISNFGILVRQRTQVLPFVLALLAATPAVRRPSPTWKSESASPHREREGSLRGPQPGSLSTEVTTATFTERG